MSEVTKTAAIELKPYIREIPDWPQPGILFRDITPLLADGAAFASACDQLLERFTEAGVGAVASIESRGFTFGAVIAYRLGVGVIPVRKAGKLPAATFSSSYQLEYAEATLEVHRDAFPAGTRVLVVDDLLATGGTAVATLELIERVGGEPVGFAFLIELLGLGGRERLAGQRVEALLSL